MSATYPPGLPQVLAWQAEVRIREEMSGNEFPRVVALALHNHLDERIIYVGLRLHGTTHEHSLRLPEGGVAPGACCALGEQPVDFAHVFMITESGRCIRSGPALLSPESGAFLHPQIPQESVR